MGSLGCLTGPQIGLEAAFLDFKTMLKRVEPVEQCGECSMSDAQTEQQQQSGSAWILGAGPTRPQIPSTSTDSSGAPEFFDS